LINLDRFSSGLPDLQEILPQPVATCADCGCELYPSDDVVVIDGDIICAIPACIVGYLGLPKISASEALGVAI
jgi:hypothetical protein